MDVHGDYIAATPPSLSYSSDGMAEAVAVPTESPLASPVAATLDDREDFFRGDAFTPLSESCKRERSGSLRSRERSEYVLVLYPCHVLTPHRCRVSRMQRLEERWDFDISKTTTEMEYLSSDNKAVLRALRKLEHSLVGQQVHYDRRR